MGPEQALEAIKLLKPEIAIPSHYNTWAPIQQDPELWAKEVQNQTTSKPLVFQPGESKEI
jgi:L-ascorbate metabolism protein UlaG (beta-lactamase superfamily)